ncbi:hypothetical protein [Trichloromonas sp.]|uniref:hypothetical protein n=1 Tax=Trichloromonas sp. TaxID=3069249 RepID=UPI002A47788A|nr:hypothetical protein [Trichloromonas sp.]
MSIRRTAIPTRVLLRAAAAETDTIHYIRADSRIFADLDEILKKIKPLDEGDLPEELRDDPAPGTINPQKK